MAKECLCLAFLFQGTVNSLKEASALSRRTYGPMQLELMACGMPREGKEKTAQKAKGGEAAGSSLTFQVGSLILNRSLHRFINQVKRKASTARNPLEIHTLQQTVWQEHGLRRILLSLNREGHHSYKLQRSLPPPSRGFSTRIYNSELNTQNAPPGGWPHHSLQQEEHGNHPHPSPSLQN